MITLQEVSKTYSLSKENTVNAVRNVSLEIKDGEFVIITGRSGSGKTTLLNLSSGLTRPTSGKIFLDDIDLWTLPDQQQSQPPQSEDWICVPISQPSAFSEYSG